MNCPKCGKGVIDITPLPALSRVMIGHERKIYRGHRVTFNEVAGCLLTVKEYYKMDDCEPLPGLPELEDSGDPEEPVG